MWKVLRKIGAFLLSGALIVTVTVMAVKKFASYLMREPSEVVMEEEVPLQKAAGFGSEVSVPVAKTSRHSKGLSSYKPSFMNIRIGKNFVVVPEAFRERMEETIKNDIYFTAVREFVGHDKDPRIFFVGEKLARRNIRPDPAPAPTRHITEEDFEALLQKMSNEILDGLGDGLLDQETVLAAVHNKVAGFTIEPDAILDPEVQREVRPKS